MKRYILALNCGSSSVKFNLFEVTFGNKLIPVMQGVAEEIGNEKMSRLKYSFDDKKHEVKKALFSHRDALTLIFSEFGKYNISAGDICAVGHRTVHGGDRYNRSVLIDNDVIQAMRDLISIAPLHNPPNITGIEEAMRLLEGVPQVAVFDTAFHAAMPGYAYRYAIPDEWYREMGIRKYGFHGTSHMYVSRRAAKLLGIPLGRFNCITAHLGNGCSITKICGGKSVDTSMGFTPLEGVVMGTRSGDIDPALIQHVAENMAANCSMDVADAYRHVINALNKNSGLKALGKTNMMQELRQKAIDGDRDAEAVISIYTYRIAKYIGAYWATMPSCHAIIFTAGIGENEWYVRKRILGFLENLSIEVDDDKNCLRKQEVIIGKSKAGTGDGLSVMVIPTDEEIVIGYDALFLGYLGTSLPEQYPFETE